MNSKPELSTIIMTPTKEQTSYYVEYTKAALSDALWRYPNIMLDKDLLNKVSDYESYECNLENKMSALKKVDRIAMYISDWFTDEMAELLMEAVKNKEVDVLDFNLNTDVR